MLNEKPKKIKDYSNPTKMQLFWRIQGECWRRAITPALMYLFTSLLAFACQAIDSTQTTALEIVLGAVCILGGAAFNAHLTYHFGKFHYDAYLTGCLHRKNAMQGITSGGDHRIEREFRVWKGFFIGFLIGVPVILFGIMAIFWSWAEVALMMFWGWAIFPVQWIEAGVGYEISAGWCMLVIILPVIISGIFYFLGAMKEKKLKEEETSRQDTIADLAKANARAERERHEQTEEQRRKTLQSKKKK